MRRAARKIWSGFARGNKGSVSIQLALSSIAILGMAALAVEITFLVYKHRQMQAAADAAAFSAAVAKQAGYPADFGLEGRAATAAVGYVNGVDGVTVAVNSPPLNGNYTANTGAVEVIVSQSQTLTLVTLFQTGLISVGARAVATPGGGGSACVLQLLNTNITGVSLSNGAIVNLVQCGLDANANSASAVSVIGGATLNTQFVSTSGRALVSNGGVINATNGIKINQPKVEDPYASVPAPTFSGCNYTNKTFGYSPARQYANPGVYCNGLTFSSSANVTMNPGVYIIDRGSFNVGGAVQLTGTGVTIYLTKSTGSSYAKVDIGNGANVTLTAPTSGTYAGLVFFGDRRAPLSTNHSFGGGATFSITGALYFPSQKVSFTNGISNPSGCTQLVAGQIQFTGGSQFKNNCSGTGVISVGGGQTTLVE